MTVEELVGARWWRVDFHAHSPSSYDFGADEGSISTNRPSVEEWLLAYMASGIDALVLTDHNSHEGIDLARSALSGLRETRPAGFREIHLFPGVEITTAGGIHLLAVFDPAEDSETINGLLHNCNYLGERGTSNRTTQKSFMEVMREVIERGGLAIPAHIDTGGGLLSMAANELASVEAAKLVTIVEATSADPSTALVKGWIPVLGSDAHHLDAEGAPDPAIAKFPGSHFTWVKMETPNLAGLRAAFSDGPTSLIRSITSEADPNTINHSSIRRVRIRQGEDDTTYEFGPWMNALIGGRGTGKSTLIEVLRLVMDRFSELPTSLKTDLSWFSTVGPSPNGTMWDANTQIEVEYVRPNAPYRISWSGADPDVRRIEVRNGDEWVHEDGSVFERFPVLLSSQKQIFEIAKQPKALLSLIDSLADVDHAGWQRAHEDLRAGYRTLRSEIMALRQQLGDESTLRGNLIDAEQTVSELVALRESPEAKEFDRLVGDERAQHAFDDAVADLNSAVLGALATFDSATVKLALAEPSGESERIWREVVTRATEQFRAAGTTLDAGLETYRSEQESADPRAARIAELRGILHPAPDDLATEDDEWLPDEPASENEPGSQVDPYDIAVARRDGLRDTVEGLDRARDELIRLEAEAATALQQVVDSRKELSERRKRALGQLSGETIELKLYPFADTTRLEADLRAIAQRPSQFDAVFDDGGLRRVLQHDHRDPAYLSDLESLRTALKELRHDGHSSTLQAIPGGRAIDQRFIGHLQDLDEFDYEVAIDLWYPEDHLEVRYSDTPGAAKRPIEQGSPGQRTAALLAVMLRLGDQPLVLDQPEDDIDNLLIYELVVRTLKEVKTRRQVIVATHNANIVVNGDAEHVTILKHGNLPLVVDSGAIQDDDVRDLICKVMEGGEPAFHARYRRLFHA